MKSRSSAFGDCCNRGLLLIPAFIIGAVAILLPDFSSMSVPALAGGHWWTLWTGHFQHWTVDHFIWDWCLFLICLSFLAKSGWLVWGWILLGLPILGIGICLAHPEMWEYRGLSGIDAALFARVAMEFHGLRRWLPLGALFAKIMYEFFDGHSLFSGDLGPNNFVVPEIHLFGLVYGLVWAWFQSPAVIAMKGEALRRLRSSFVENFSAWMRKSTL